MAKDKKPHAPRNYKLPGGTMRFSRARMYQIKAVYKKKPFLPVAEKTSKPETHKVVKIGGEKNGGERRVPVSRAPKTWGSEKERATHKARNAISFSQHKRRLRSTLTPGTVVIMLAGVHKGKRAVFLKQLSSGLLLVTGPMKLNKCPMRRIAQCFVIATKTKLDISSVKIPDNINDDYFKRQKRQRRVKDAETDIFAQRKETYQVSDQRKADQKTVDTQVLQVIRKNPEKKYLFGYLGSTFSLRKGERPHAMVF